MCVLINAGRHVDLFVLGLLQFERSVWRCLFDHVGLSHEQLGYASKLAASAPTAIPSIFVAMKTTTPKYASDKDCKFDFHNEAAGMPNVGRGPGTSWDRFKWECCGQIDGEDEETCFEGHHISDWSEGGDYWKDRAK